jgi:mitochondrial fission protein ELM1
LRGIKAHYFDVVFTIQAEQENLAHYLYYPIAPNKMCALALTQIQARTKLGISSSAQVITVLIGADTKTVSIGSVEEWGAVLQKMRSEYPTAHILLTTSRRTSIEFEQRLEEFCHAHDIFQDKDQMTWVAQGQQCDIKDYILAADWILSSADSTSMMAEVVMSGQPLIVFSDATKMHDAAIQQQLQFLEQQKWITSYDLSNSFQFKQALQFLAPKNHSMAMASELERRLN